jgi:hypothetical protein
MTQSEPKKLVNRGLLRIQFDVTPMQMTNIEELIREFSSVISNKRELLNNAISLLKWAVQERKRGRAIGALDTENKVFYSLTFPALDEIQIDTRLKSAQPNAKEKELTIA